MSFVPVSDDVRVLVRGWLHGNVVAVDEPGDPPSVTLIDTGYHSGVEPVLASCPRVARIVLTHAHSDHAGGVAAIVAAHGARVLAHPDVARLTEPWDPRGLWLDPTHQDLPVFGVDEVLGGTVVVGGRPWEVVDAGGHATGGVALFDGRTLVTGDALWEDGFGLLNPWIDGPGVFAAAAAALDALAALPAPITVVPGHGAPFVDRDGAVARARSRLARLVARPDRLRFKVLRDYLGFWRLASPGATADELRARASDLADALPPLEGDPGHVDLDAVVAGASGGV